MSNPTTGYVPIDAHRVTFIAAGLLALWWPPLAVTALPFALAVLYAEARAVVRHRQAIHQLRAVLANA